MQGHNWKGYHEIPPTQPESVSMVRIGEPNRVRVTYLYPMRILSFEGDVTVENIDSKRVDVKFTRISGIKVADRILP